MRSILLALLALGASLWTAQALEVGMDQSEENRQYCTGMYSRTSWGGPVEPFILVKFLNATVQQDDAIASLVIFEWKDSKLVGIPSSGSPNQLGLCQDDYIKQGLCNTTDRGKFILAPNATEDSTSLILTKAVHLDDATPIRYAIKKTGFYCVVTEGFNIENYQAVVEFRNAHGTATMGSQALLIVVGILNAARNSFSFFLLLIVCMGYGVVKPTLGRTMIYVRWLAAAHFVFGLVYSITSMLISPENAGPLVLLIVLPLAATLTAFYIWTLNSLNFTLKDLRDRKQHIKEAMYKKLWWAILISVLVIFGFFFLNSFTFASVNDPDFVPFHWKTRWFILDGWLNIVYFADVVWVAYIWRPTANNRRFAMSDEIAQDDDGNFEIGDIGMPGDSDDDEEAHVGKSTISSQRTREIGLTPPESSQASRSRGLQPPASTIPRESIEGETIFAVGEDGDKASDDGSGEEVGGESDEDNEDTASDEDTKLVKKTR
ncbi:Membrane protein PTM1 [Escovopsis weberi]|uniref:Membrane protein PTM1 n=1 Tax=Escovopsis weberi TaxID=150374 RepID=A0A0M8MWZ8_ESCWE|nr:Membrane protein PTM1 [Escovopsis weberi]